MSQIFTPDVVDVCPRGLRSAERHAAIEAVLSVVGHEPIGIRVPCWVGIEQQHGFVHGAVVGLIVFSAADCAAMTPVLFDAADRLKPVELLSGFSMREASETIATLTVYDTGVNSLGSVFRHYKH